MIKEDFDISKIKMIKEDFDISKKPLLLYANHIYLVDSKNVNLHRQYVETYYDNDELKWFDINVLSLIRRNKDNIFMLRYADDVIVGYRPRNADEVSKYSTIHYIKHALMTVE